MTAGEVKRVIDGATRMFQAWELRLPFDFRKMGKMCKKREIGKNNKRLVFMRGSKLSKRNIESFSRGSEDKHCI